MKKAILILLVLLPIGLGATTLKIKFKGCANEFVYNSDNYWTNFHQHHGLCVDDYNSKSYPNSNEYLSFCDYTIGKVRHAKTYVYDYENMVFKMNEFLKANNVSHSYKYYTFENHLPDVRPTEDVVLYFGQEMGDGHKHQMWGVSILDDMIEYIVKGNYL